jgi:hypothetical protein
MPYTDDGLPFAPRSHTSWKAAIDAAPRHARKRDRLLALYAEYGALSDPEVEVLTGWPRSTICSVRNGISLKLVKDGTAKSQYGKACDRWRLA